jgi:hypothetical protein
VIISRLEEAGYFVAIRLPANNVLREKIAHRLTRPPKLYQGLQWWLESYRLVYGYPAHPSGAVTILGLGLSCIINRVVARWLE